MLQNFLLQQQPETEVVCFKGRQGSFEVKIDDNLVHSKLQSFAFPDHESVLENVRKAEKCLPVEKVKEQPIENCVLMWSQESHFETENTFLFKIIKSSYNLLIIFMFQLFHMHCIKSSMYTEKHHAENEHKILSK